MPFITEEIHDVLYKEFTKSKSIHMEHFPIGYKNLSDEKIKQGKIVLEIIKNLRTIKAKHGIPLNQEVTRVIILSDKNKQEIINDLKEDIKNTIRIKNLEIYEKNQEGKIKDKPDLKEIIDELGISFYFSL